MRKIYATIVAALALAVGADVAFASTLTPEQALERALSTTTIRKVRPTATAPQYKLAYRAPQNEVYLFSAGTGEGYLVVAADDMAPAVLGYSDSGTFDADNMPPAMQWWLGEYGRQIEAARATGAEQRRIARSARTPIEPMVKTRWNQDAPFNNDCPLINGSRAVTGCVATALAQIMYYHQWPAKGQGSNSYTTSTTGTSLSLDFSTITFEWDKMLDVYGSTENSAADAAVAQLMYACGVAVDMNYTATESGASSFDIPTAMVKYFNYDAGIQYASRDYYGLVDWEDFVYSQLTNYGPVQYSGQSNQGGHSFVCDGYSSDGYFHINWGWGGMSDGYFLLTALDPGQQGIGGSTSGFNYSQDIIANVSKPKAGSTMYVNMMMESSLSVSQTTATLGGRITVMGNTYNFSTGSVSGAFGIKLTAADGTVSYVKGTSVSDIEPLSGVGGYYVTLPATLAAGTYYLTPAFYTQSGMWQDIPVKLGGTQQVKMVVSGNTATFSAVAGASIDATDLQVLTPIYLGSAFHLTATLTNSGAGEYYGTIAPALVDDSGSIVALGDYIAIDLVGGDSQTLDYVGKFSQYSSAGAPAAGDYTLYLIDTSSYEPISDGVDVAVKSASSTSIAVSNLAVVGDINKVNSSDATFTATVRCTAGFFGGTLTLAIFPYSTSSVSSIGSLTSQSLFIEAGNSETATFSGTLSGTEKGSRYMAAVFNGSSQLTNVVIFTIDNGNVALTDVENSDGDDEVVAAYDLSGRRIDAAAATGVYIERRASGASTLHIQRRR